MSVKCWSERQMHQQCLSHTKVRALGTYTRKQTGGDKLSNIWKNRKTAAFGQFLPGTRRDWIRLAAFGRIEHSIHIFRKETEGLRVCWNTQMWNGINCSKIESWFVSWHATLVQYSIINWSLVMLFSSEADIVVSVISWPTCMEHDLWHLEKASLTKTDDFSELSSKWPLHLVPTQNIFFWFFIGLVGIRQPPHNLTIRAPPGDANKET